MSTSVKPTTVHLESGDARLERALGRMTLEELNRLQDVLFARLRTGLPSPARIASALESENTEVAYWFRLREAPTDAVKVVMLLGALAVATAWMTHRGGPAPAPKLQDAIARVREDHVYMLPIPRSDPCFCGSSARFRDCHGKPPTAVPHL